MAIKKFSISSSSSDKVSTNTGSQFLMDGLTAETAAPSARYLYDQGVRTDGGYWIKGNGTKPYYMWCAMNAGGWMLMLTYKDSTSSGFSVTDIPVHKISYVFNANDGYNFTVPSAIESGCRYAAFSSDYDMATPQAPATENSFKYVIEYKDSVGTVKVDRIQQFILSSKTQYNYWGMGSVSGTAASYVSYTASSLGITFRRFGSSFNLLYVGDDANRSNIRDESDTITLRNGDGTGSISYSAGNNAYNRIGWGAVDASGPTLAATAWGSFGRDLSDYPGSPKVSDRIFMWIR
jgi:hypothetical protein